MTAVDSIGEIRPLAEAWGTQLLGQRSATVALQIEELGLRLWAPIQRTP